MTGIGDLAGATPAAERDATLAELFRAHHGSLVRTAAVLVGDAGAAEEVVQDAYVKLHGALGRLRDPEAAAGYLRATVVNLVRSRLRHRLVVRRHPPPLPLPGPGADEAAGVSEDHREVVAALMTLPRRQRECLVLRHYLGLCEAEIAAALSISAGSVKTHTSRGMAHLRARLESP